MKQSSLDRLALELSKLLTRIHDYCKVHCDKGQPFGACTANPKNASVPFPTNDIKAELERRATEYFQKTSVAGYYFRYWTPPLLPISDKKEMKTNITADDYQLSFELPTFDENWEQTAIARSLIYCALDYEQHGWSDWFEIQLEAIRFTPLIHQMLKEYKIKTDFEFQLTQSAESAFVSFIYDYGVGDQNFPEVSKSEKESWVIYDELLVWS